MTNKLENKSIEELLELQQDISELIITKQKEKKAELKMKFQELANEAGLTIDEILSKKKEAKKVPAKYSKDGNTWSGRGRRPAWIVELTEAGKNIDNYLV